MVFFHGRFKINIIEAKNLPDADIAYFQVSDPYVIGVLGKAKLFKTKYKLNNLNPKWNESFNINVCHEAKHLKLEIMDKDDLAADDFLGEVLITAQELLSGGFLMDIFKIFFKNVQNIIQTKPPLCS